MTHLIHEMPVRVRSTVHDNFTYMKDYSDAELKQLAMDIVDGKVFTDKHIPDNQQHMLTRVFIPLMLGGLEQINQDGLLDNVGMIYEYYSEAGPRGINGMPIFMSFRYLTVADAKRTFEFYDDYLKLKASFYES